MGAFEDPIFDSWSAEEPSTASAPPSTDVPDEPEEHVQRPELEEHGHRPEPVSGPAGVIRALVVPRLEAIGRRLAVGRHVTEIQDLLDGPPHLVRFELKPWAGPFSASRRPRRAMLEIGLGTSSDGLVTAWYWLELDESPDEVVSVPTGALSADWIGGVVLDFVGKVLREP